MALIKFFSAILLIPLLIFFILTSYSNKNFTFFIFYAVWIFGLVFALFFLLEELNSLRLSFYFENYNTDYGFVEISNLYQLIIEVSGALRKFFFSPNIFEVKNMFEFAQSFENIIIFMVLIFYFVRSFKINSRYAFFFLMLLFTFSIAYGLVVFNIGTLCRYKFPIIFTIIAAISMVDSKEFWGYSE